MLAPLWDPEGIYLNTASYGLPPRPAWDALQQVLGEWRGGRTSWEGWASSADEARATFARLVGVGPGDVAIGATVAGFLGVVAASLPARARVVVPEGDFTSVLWPFLVRENTRVVALADLAEAASSADVVAFSAVQSADGTIADLDALAGSGAMTIVDATQAIGWLPFDAARFDVVAVHAYKWLMSPRGTAFMTVRRDRLDGIVPWTANWFAGEDPHGSYYGSPVRLASDARRLDTSPAWHNWVGTAATLRVVEELGVDRIHAHDLELANRFRAGLGLPAGDNPIVVAEAERAPLLERAGIVAAVRAGRLRASWHAYNGVEDVDRVLDVLAG